MSKYQQSHADPFDQSLLGNEGTIQSVTGNTHRGPRGFYFVKFDGAVMFAITADDFARAMDG